MNYKNLASYKCLIDLGCKETTGPVQIKKGIVKITIGGYNGSSISQPYYHFDPNYKYNNKVVVRAMRRSTYGSSSNIFIKDKNSNVMIDYDLAFLSFILNIYGIRKIIPTYDDINRLFSKNKEKIFERVFK